MHPLDWVEAVGVVIATLPPVAFARAIGVPCPRCRRPCPARPTGREAAELAPATLNWVPVAAPGDRVASVVQALSALPDEYDNMWRLADAQYMSDEQMDDPLLEPGHAQPPADGAGGRPVVADPRVLLLNDVALSDAQLEQHRVRIARRSRRHRGG